MTTLDEITDLERLVATLPMALDTILDEDLLEMFVKLPGPRRILMRLLHALPALLRLARVGAAREA